MTFHYGNVARLPLTNWPAYFSDKLRTAREGEFSSLINGLASTSSKTKTIHSLNTSVQELNDQAAAAYHPTPYPGRVILFKPEINYDVYPDPLMGWGDLVTGQLDVAELPVNPHAMLVEPYVKLLATHLKEAIDAATPLPIIGKLD
ncbi:MAG TPA: hypothetical protein VIT23_09355 [Terrimicrobiaceae bacterium]